MEGEPGAALGLPAEGAALAFGGNNLATRKKAWAPNSEPVRRWQARQ